MRGQGISEPLQNELDSRLLSLVTDGQSSVTEHLTKLSSTLINLDIVAIGVNCKQHNIEALSVSFKATDKPIIVYPNNGTPTPVTRLGAESNIKSFSE